jgi:aminopeptidase YwaD
MPAIFGKPARAGRIAATLLVAALLAACAPVRAAPAQPAPPAAVAESGQDAPPAPPRAAGVEFSAERALAHVTHLAGAIGPRDAGSPSSERAAAYIAASFAAAGLQVERQPFTFPQFQERQAALRLDGQPVTAHALVYSGSGEVSGPLVWAGFGRPDDIPHDVAGGVALIERGAGVPFRDKAAAVAHAGARAAVIFNSGQGGFAGSLQTPAAIPVVAISGDDGRRLREVVQNGPHDAHLVVDASVDERRTENVVATRPGSGDTVVVVGAHYDSVPISPGANDNASGTAVVLELARVFAGSSGNATIRFVAFGAEEVGLLGSAHYVDGLSTDERARVVAMLNFDMVGVGDDVQVGGDDALAARVRDLAAQAGLSVGRIDDGFLQRSDQGPFLAAQIPAVFFSVSDDPNYHTPDDVAAHISPARLGQVGGLAAQLLHDIDIAG